MYSTAGMAARSPDVLTQGMPHTTRINKTKQSEHQQCHPRVGCAFLSPAPSERALGGPAIPAVAEAWIPRIPDSAILPTLAKSQARTTAVVVIIAPQKAPRAVLTDRLIFFLSASEHNHITTTPRPSDLPLAASRHGRRKRKPPPGAGSQVRPLRLPNHLPQQEERPPGVHHARAGRPGLPIAHDAGGGGLYRETGHPDAGMHAPPLLCGTTVDISSLSCDFCGLASLMSPSRRRCTLSRLFICTG